MDKTIRKKSPSVSKDRPVVVYANWFQFGPSERKFHQRVESRMLLWCQDGKGRLGVNRRELAFEAGDWLLLPWDHEIIYMADAKNPFFVGGIHVIPRYSDHADMTFHVAHNRSDKLAGDPGRSDGYWPGLEKLVSGRFAGETCALKLFATYVVERFQHSKPERKIMSALASLLISEISIAATSQPSGFKALPGGLRRMQEYVKAHMGQTLSVEDLARAARCSVASVHRLFNAYESLSPGRWMARARAESAARLLRTTTLTVREVGEKVGLGDPFHFSRFFKREMGVSPRAYHQDRRFL